MADPPYWQYLWRCALGFLLGVLSFVPAMVAGEGLSIVAGLICVMIYFFVCQFLLSIRENNYLFFNRVVGSNMPIIVALDLPLLIMFLMILHGEKRGVVLAQGVPSLVLGCASTCAGAAMAMFVARRKVEHRRGAN